MYKINERIGERIRDRKIAKCYNAVMGFWIIARIACHVTDLTGKRCGILKEEYMKMSAI